MKNLKITIAFVALITLGSSMAMAETTISKEGQYIFNTLAFYLGGILVAFMAASAPGATSSSPSIRWLGKFDFIFEQMMSWTSLSYCVNKSLVFTLVLTISAPSEPNLRIM